MSAMALEKKHVIDAAIELIRLFHDQCANSPQREELKKRTPTWLAPLILMIDLYEKAAVAAKRRLRVAEETNHVWKWFDINSGKWCSYSSQNNYIIDKAFWDGESSVRITAGRRRYVINFTAMIQLNEETSNRRPITLWLKQKPGDTTNPAASIAAAHALAVAGVTNTPRPTTTGTGTGIMSESDHDFLWGVMPDPRTLSVHVGATPFDTGGRDDVLDLLWAPFTETVPDVTKNAPKAMEESVTPGPEPAAESCKMPRLKGLDIAQKKQIVEYVLFTILKFYLYSAIANLVIQSIDQFLFFIFHL